MTYKLICEDDPYTLTKSLNKTSGELLSIFEVTAEAKYGDKYSFRVCAIIKE